MTKRDLVNRALREFIQRRRLAGARGDDHLSALEVVGYLLFVCSFVAFALASAIASTILQYIALAMCFGGLALAFVGNLRRNRDG